ncbi:MAG: phospho-N-acetylmuramoyl-pentapeptide-transferase [Armatimonadota bacterium]|nr:MAG: phospho-N-acetylmuramoyl-pentapeptide-transferase [Armatimonadota bacterium]
MDEARAVAGIAIIPTISLLVVLLLGRHLIALLRRMGAGQRVRNDGPQRHLEKEGTPTMGGLLVIGAVLIAVFAAALPAEDPPSLRLITLAAVMLAFGIIGFADDWLKIRRGRSLGMRAREKLALQCLAGIAFAYALAVETAARDYAGLPPYPHFPGYGWLAFWSLAAVATSNAVNLADGLDGLAAGLCVVAGVGFGLLGGAGEVQAFGLALAGACLGFLWFNRHPARLFMGDVGSLALGASLAAMAAIMNNPAALLGLCLVPYIEAGSVVVQVASFKATGRRVFKMSPIHHHFELSGWSERRVVWTFWGVALAAAVATALFVPIMK